MANMMRNGRSGGCKCCNDWSQIGRTFDKRNAAEEIKQELWEPVDWMRWLPR